MSAGLYRWQSDGDGDGDGGGVWWFIKRTALNRDFCSFVCLFGFFAFISFIAIIVVVLLNNELKKKKHTLK